MPECKVTALINFIAPFYPVSAENPEWSIIFFCQQKFIRNILITHWNFIFPRTFRFCEILLSKRPKLVYGYHHLSTYRTYDTNLVFFHECVIWQSSARSHFLTIKTLDWSISCISYMTWNAATILNMGDVLAPV